jgi:GDP-L-fucose synthase
VADTMLDLRDRRITVTGGAGFLGSFLIEQLRARGCEQISVPTIEEYDLTRQEDVERVFADQRPEVVFHLAAEVGGIGANRDNPGRYFYANAIMGINMIEAARVHGVEKFIQVGTICAYPKFAPVPFKETDLWCGYPEETNAPYGVAKKSLLVMLQAYRDQYGFNGIYLLPVNLYGPRDNFHLHTSHVIPALIRKCVEAVEAGQTEIEAWGTGNATREFFYVEDCAEGLILAAERYDGPEPVNLGRGEEVSIKKLLETIAELTGFGGTIRWDTSKPDGQPRRCLETTRARKRFGFTAKTALRTGLARTIDWYRANRHTWQRQ